MAIPALLAALGRSAGGAALEGAAGGSGAAQAAAAKLNQTYQQQAQRAGQAYNALQHIPAKLNEISNQWVRTLATGSDAIKALAGPMKELVGLSNPAAVTQFNLAVRDMDAVIGRILLPVFKSLTGAARQMGDAYATVEKQLKPLTNAVGGALLDSFTALGTAIKDNQLAIKVLADSLAFGVNIAGKLTTSMFKVFSVFGLLTNKMLGINFGPDASARGAAVRNVSIGRSGEDVARKAQEAAFQQGMGTETEEVKQTNYLKDINDFIRGTLSTEQLTALVVRFAQELMKIKAKDVKEGIADAANSGVNLGGIAGAAGRWAASLATR